MKAVAKLTVVLIGLLWTFGLATLMVAYYFAALFNDYQVLLTINEYGEYVFETPLLILGWPIMLFSTIFCMRSVTRIARVIRALFVRRIVFGDVSLVPCLDLFQHGGGLIM